MKPEVMINVNKRWEDSIEHDHRSREIFDFISGYDFKFTNDYFGWKSGGDGDNGENLMYHLDEYFACKDSGGKFTVEELNEEMRKVLMRLCKISCLYKDEGVPNLCGNCIIGFALNGDITTLRDIWKAEDKNEIHT